MAQENVDVSRRLIDEAFNKGNVDVIDELVSEDVVDHDPMLGDQDRDAVKQTLAGYRHAFPDIHITVDEALDAGDKVVLRWTGEGTFENEFAGMEPTHEKGDPIKGCTIDRFEDGKVVETWTYFDTLTFMRNVGAIPEAEAAPAS
jgi:steroid delta-isomerase-like uncharacterized protein